MKIKLILAFVFVFIMLLFVGCSQETAHTSEANGSSSGLEDIAQDSPSTQNSDVNESSSGSETAQNGETKVVRSLSEAEEDSLELFQSNIELLNRFVEELSCPEDSFSSIRIKDGKVQYLESIGNKKLKEKVLNEELAQLLLEIFEGMKCENISFFSEQKIMILLGGFIVGKSAYYTDSLYYYKDVPEDVYGKEIAPGWYYETLFYCATDME